MKTRPTSVTVISWILIVMGGIWLIESTIMLNNPLAKDLMASSPIPVPLQFATWYVGVVVMIASGLAMLKGQNWARLLCVIGGAVGGLIGLATSPTKVVMIPSFLFYVVIVFFLFRPKVQEYFGKSVATGATESH
ncbi:MAG TPA: hypothetical protein VKO18_19985 [Terriglobia bacterium]|nr:hypothetical protein [Terriglobia bacterium]